MESIFLTTRGACRYINVLKKLGHRVTCKLVRGEWVVGVLL